MSQNQGQGHKINNRVTHLLANRNKLKWEGFTCKTSGVKDKDLKVTLIITKSETCTVQMSYLITMLVGRLASRLNDKKNPMYFLINALILYFFRNRASETSITPMTTIESSLQKPFNLFFNTNTS